MKALAGLSAPSPPCWVLALADEELLWQWIDDARAADLPNPHSFSRGIDPEVRAATAAVTLPLAR